MRLQVVKSVNAASLYVVKSVYENGKRTSKVVEKLGTYDELLKKLDGKDPIEWGKAYAEELTIKEKEGRNAVLVKYSPIQRIEKDQKRSFNGGYLFLQKLYHELGLDSICKTVASKHKFSFNLDSILSRLIYSRIIYPGSKLATFQLAQNFLEQPDFEIHHIYRALEVLSRETDFIQAQLYKNSLSLSKRNDKILYYDCTNYFFETEQAEGVKQYGHSKEHRPNPIVQMGLFMDGDGIPLAFSVSGGNVNEQTTLKPLEQTILDDFKLSKFVVCTDAGLSSAENRKFNNIGDRAFITTQSVKKLKKHIKEWVLAEDKWRLIGDTTNNNHNIRLWEREHHMSSEYSAALFYKECWIKEDGLEQKLIVTYSPKHKDYQHSIRSAQLERAQKLIKTGGAAALRRNANDCKRFIKTTSLTQDGEIAERRHLSIDCAAVEAEEIYDGFYAVCTNLEDEAPEIAKINRRRWEIEECFRIMKTDFKARPVFLQRDDRIRAHFTSCFLALTLYRYLEKRLGHEYTNSDILHGLRGMNFYHIPGEGYVPTYTRNDLTDALHEAFGFRTDNQIITLKALKNIFKHTKS